MDGELTQCGAKGPELGANDNCSPTSSFVSCFLRRFCNCHFSIFSLIVMFVVVTLVANWNTFQQTIRIRGECICSSTCAVPIDVFIWKAITFLCGYLSLCGVVSSLCLVVTSLCLAVTSLCLVVTSLCLVVSSLCLVVTSLCLVVSSLCLVVTSLCGLFIMRCGLFIMWCGFVFMFCWLHFRYKALVPRLYSLLGTSQTGFKRGPSSCSSALSKITKWQEQATIHLVGPGSEEFVRKPLAGGGEFVIFSRSGESRSFFNISLKNMPNFIALHISLKNIFNNCALKDMCEFHSITSLSHSIFCIRRGNCLPPSWRDQFAHGGRTINVSFEELSLKERHFLCAWMVEAERPGKTLRDIWKLI